MISTDVTNRPQAMVTVPGGGAKEVAQGVRSLDKCTDHSPGQTVAYENVVTNTSHAIFF